MCRVTCVGVKGVGWKLEQPLNVKSSEVVWEAMKLLLSCGVDDCSE